MAGFWRDRRWARFDSFVEQFETNPRSWLRWAQDNDVDRYEAAVNADKVKKGAGKVETFEWSQTNSQLNRVIAELSHLAHVTAVKGTRNQRKRWKAPSLSWPFTAVDGLKERAQAVRSEATKAFMDMFVPVPQDEWEAEMAEHQAALEAGVPSPVQGRAMAEARADRDTDLDLFDTAPATSSVVRGGLGVPSARSDL